MSTISFWPKTADRAGFATLGAAGRASPHRDRQVDLRRLRAILSLDPGLGATGGARPLSTRFRAWVARSRSQHPSRAPVFRLWVADWKCELVRSTRPVVGGQMLPFSKKTAHLFLPVLILSSLMALAPKQRNRGRSSTFMGPFDRKRLRDWDRGRGGPAGTRLSGSAMRTPPPNTPTNSLSSMTRCKPNVAVQQATKMAAKKTSWPPRTGYCPSTSHHGGTTPLARVRPAGSSGRCAARRTYRNKYAEVHHVNDTMINQNETNAELLTKLGYKTFAIIHDTTTTAKGAEQYFSKRWRRRAESSARLACRADQQDFTAELHAV